MLTNDEYRDTYLALHVCMKARVPVILWGPPGQGKTSVIKALAAHEERRLEVLLASIREPQDFAGLPSISNGRMTLVAPDWAQDLAADGNGILFMDEVNTAPPAVQAALLRVSLDKVVGDLHLGDGTSVVAAANPPEQAADGWDLAPPLANRFCHLDWSLPSQIVRSGLSGSWPQYRAPSATDEELAKALEAERVVFGGFLTARPDLVTHLPSSSQEQGRAFPTPRSWEATILLSAWVTACGMSDSVRSILVRGMIGMGAAIEYLSYRENTNLPDPEEVLAADGKYKLPVKPDEVYSIGVSVLSAVRGDNTVARWHSAGNVLESIAKRWPDMAMALAIDWMSNAPLAEKKTANTQRNTERPNKNVLAALFPLMVEAKVVQDATQGTLA